MRVHHCLGQGHGQVWVPRRHPHWLGQGHMAMDGWFTAWWTHQCHWLNDWSVCYILLITPIVSDTPQLLSPARHWMSSRAAICETREYGSPLPTSPSARAPYIYWQLACSCFTMMVNYRTYRIDQLHFRLPTFHLSNGNCRDDAIWIRIWINTIKIEHVNT